MKVSQEIYSNQLYSKQPLTITDVVTRRYDEVHKQMFKRALSKYIKEVGYNEDDYKYLEITNSYYNIPSKVQIINKYPPYSREIVDLTPYWEDTVFTSRFSYKDIEELQYKNCEIIYKDYSKGVAKLKNKLTNQVTVVKLTDLPENLDNFGISESNEIDSKYQSTFSYKYNHKLFGQI